MEMMVIIAVVSILAGLTFVGGERFLSRTRDERQQANVSVLSLKLERYYKYHSAGRIGHEYPSCKDLLKDFRSIIGDDSLKKELVKCNRSEWAGGHGGELLYEASNIDNGDCTKPSSGAPSDIVAATCVKYSITYKERSTGIEKKVDSIWRD